MTSAGPWISTSTVLFSEASSYAQSPCSTGAHTSPPEAVDLCLTLYGDNKLLGDPLEAMQVLDFFLSLDHYI